MLTYQKCADNPNCFRFYESLYRVLVVCQKLVVKRYPIKRYKIHESEFSINPFLQKK